MIAECHKPFTDGEFVKKMYARNCQKICSAKESQLSEISLFAQTIAGRIDNGDDLSNSF